MTITYNNEKIIIAKDIEVEENVGRKGKKTRIRVIPNNNDSRKDMVIVNKEILKGSQILDPRCKELGISWHDSSVFARRSSERF